MKETKIKHEYAYNSHNELINITQVNKESIKTVYTCIGCGKILIPRLGKIKKHHFAHKDEAVCSGETYLHKLGKQVFLEEFKKCSSDKKPFIIELYLPTTCTCYKEKLGIECTQGIVKYKYDLTKYFDDIKYEEREGVFVPDLMLFQTAGDKKIFIEIAVTHQLSEEKKSSKYQIIEILIKSEKDLEIIKRNILNEKDAGVIFKNFIRITKSANICNYNCKDTYDFFVLFKSGHSVLFHYSLSEISTFIDKEVENIRYYSILENTNYNENLKYKYLIADAYRKKLNIKNCFICRYHANNRTDNLFLGFEENYQPIYCKFLKIKCKSNHAVKCQYYRPDEKQVERRLQVSDTVRSILFKQQYLP